MNAEAIIVALLKADATVTGLVADRIKPSELAQGLARPAVVYDHISTVTHNTLSTAEAVQRKTSRIQLTVLAGSYPQQKSLLKACADACKYRRGTIAGVHNVSVLPDVEGPDMRNKADSVIYLQTIDFKVGWNQPR